MGRRQGGPSRTGARGAYLNRYVTTRNAAAGPFSSQPLWAGASWLFFRVARSTPMIQIWALYRQSGSDRLEKQPTDLRQTTSYFGDRTLDACARTTDSSLTLFLSLWIRYCRRNFSRGSQSRWHSSSTRWAKASITRFEESVRYQSLGGIS